MKTEKSFWKKFGWKIEKNVHFQFSQRSKDYNI